MATVRGGRAGASGLGGVAQDPCFASVRRTVGLMNPNDAPTPPPTVSPEPPAPSTLSVTSGAGPLGECSVATAAAAVRELPDDDVAALLVAMLAGGHQHRWVTVRSSSHGRLDFSD